MANFFVNVGNSSKCKGSNSRTGKDSRFGPFVNTLDIENHNVVNNLRLFYANLCGMGSELFVLFCRAFCVGIFIDYVE